MSSLHITILYTLLTIIIADNKTFYFTKSNYDLWCQENILSNSVFLYPNRLPIGIYRTSNIKSITYQLINDNNNGLFQIKTKRLADFYFLIINITRPFDINREYQDVYTLHIQANIITTQENQTEQTELRLHVADANDNDGVFDMDIYEQNYTKKIEISQSLLRVHASDADEIQHAQILYESASSLNETFSLHPFTGELYLITKENLKTSYEFDIYAYDRYRKRLVDNNMKTKTHVKLNFNQTNLLNTKLENFQTIFNQTIEYQELITTYEINIFERKSINLLNIHQPILTINIKSYEDNFEIFLLNNSSLNTKNLFILNENIYLNQYEIEEYNLQLFICFNKRLQCQYLKYRLIPYLNYNFSKFHFQTIEKIYLDENLPVDSYITRIQIDYKNFDLQISSLIINYKLLNDEKNFQFYIHPKTGIIRLAERLEYRIYILDIQANIQLFNRRYSIETTIEININEINKYRPIFHNNTPNELFQLPYQFQAIDYDHNKQTNGRITYRLWNCENICPFQIDPNNGTLTLKTSMENKIYNLQIIAFDWGQPISLESSINIRINLLSLRLNKRDLTRTRAYSRRWRKKTTANLFTTATTISTEKSLYTTTPSSNIDTVYLNVGFSKNMSSYYLSEDAEINTIIDNLKIEYDSFPLNLNNEKDNIFFYTINDTNIPFIIDQNNRFIKLIAKLDREKQNQYIFEIELKLKSIYSIKLQEEYLCENKTNSFINFQYTNKYYQKMIIIININDINDNIPKCQYFHSKIFLNENTIQKNIFQIQANDPDLGENGTITYSLFDYQQYFFINPSTGQIDCIKSLDYEEYSSIELHIIASDQGIQLQYQTICTTLHIIINDLNDNTPQFPLNNYIYHLFSDMPRYSIFGQILAKDIDKNDQLIYSISPNPYIIINKLTGYLSLKHNLYRLIDQILNVTIYVSDGLHKNQTSINIYIQLFPDAQEPILLSEPAYALTINESLTIGSIITNVYRRFQLTSTSIDFIEIIHDDDDDELPFSIDQQGYIRLINSLIGLTKSSYWLSIRLTRYRAHPPHTYIHIHISIRQENFYLPQCVDLYQDIKVYDYSIQYPFAQIEVKTLKTKYSSIQYSFDNNENIFSINKQTGLIHLLPSIQTHHRRFKTDYLLTIKALDIQTKFSINCYLKVHLIRRRQLIPKFISSTKIDLPEIEINSGRLRQRLFQIIALLDSQVYDKKLEIRYRFTDINQHFIINRQTGYIAAKQPLNPYTTYEFNIEAFTVAYRDEILSDINENEDDEHLNRGKWRIVSSRVTLPIKIRILPLILLNKSSSLLSIIDSTINVDLLITTNVGSIILQLGLNNQLNNNSQWFIMIGHIHHTRYFHVDFQTGQLILIRPINELINQTNLIELRINVTNNWINMNTIKVIIHLINNQPARIKFSQNDYYSSISKSIPIGAEIAHLTIENSSDDCLYSIDNVERIKSKDLFHINQYTGSITILNSLENSTSQTHLLIILYRCEHNSYITYTNLHINILDEKNLINQTKKLYRFIQKTYLIIFETSLIQNQKKYLMNFQLINDDGIRMKSQAKIFQGDPLGLFSIDSSNQSLILIDESLARSYIYPINLTIIDTSQNDIITSNVIIFISNIGIHFPCPSYLKTSPYLFTYQSLPQQSIDLLTGQQYKSYDSLIIHAFDSFTPLNGEASNQAECIINSQQEFSTKSLINNLEFIFENEHYFGYINQSFGSSSYVYNYQQQPVQIQLKLPHTFDITYHIYNETNQKIFQLDEYAGLIKTNFLNQILLNQYSFLIYAKYENLVTFTRLNLLINHNISSKISSFQSIYEFKLYTPFVNNYTIGYLNKTILSNWMILNEHILPMISIENKSGRLFIKNRTLLLTNGNFYDFLIQNEDLEISRIQIIILTSIEPIYECFINRLNSSNDKQLIGFIDIINNQNQRDSICNSKLKTSFKLLNYNHLFLLDRQHGLLYYQNQSQIIYENNFLLLIQINRSRCLVTLNQLKPEVLYKMIRNQSQEMKEQYHIEKSSGQLKFANGTLMNYDIIPSYAPIFSSKSYEFSLNLSNIITSNRIYIGQIFGEPYNINRSHLVYEFLNETKYFLVNIDNGIIENIPNQYYNKTTIEKFQIIIRDLIYQETTRINITIYINKLNKPSLSIYSQTISEILPPGSIIFQPNISTNEHIQYSLRDYNSEYFQINSFTGEVILLKYLIDKFYSFKISIYPINQILIIKLNIINYNKHSPKFLNLPLNLSLSTRDIFITKLLANDLDLYDNLKLQYYILDSHNENIFSINQTNGILTLKSTQLKPFYQLNLGVSDGLYLTKNYLQINFFNYSNDYPKFSSNEYIFHYDQTRDIVGQILAYDTDINDKIIYELYLQPNEIQIDQLTGIIKIEKGFFSKPIFEFYASAIDLAKQIVYTKIKIIYLIQPKFQSNLFFINLIQDNLIIPSEIYQFNIVDLFNQTLKSVKYQIKNQTNLFEINDNKLIIKENFSLENNYYLLNINAYWKNFILQTFIQIKFVEKIIKLEKEFYQFSIEKNLLKENYFIENFSNNNNFLLKILSTPLTRNDCHENFYVKQNQLFFKTFPILSNLCFFELQFTDNKSLSSSQIEISFINSNNQPKFSSKIYYFYFYSYENIFQVFANGSNTIEYQLQNNSYGLFINQNNGRIKFKYNLDLNQNIQLNVYAIDKNTNLYDTALVSIIFNDIKSFQVPENSSDISLCPNIPIILSDQSLPGTVIQDINNNNISNIYYIVSGDKYGLFAINNFGQLYLTSSILNQTNEEYFELIILISSISYCYTNISIQRTPKWSNFICPSIPIEWIIEEESPIGTIIGTIKDTLLLINNSSKLIDKLSFKINNNNNHEQSFLLNSQTGLITSNSRLDYEQKSFYSFIISIEPIELNCSIEIQIQLLNINDNKILFDLNSLNYNITENNFIPFYIGRIKLIDIDQLFLSKYEFFLKNFSSEILLDQTTGSIILNEKFDREYHGSSISYEIISIDRNNYLNNLTNILTLSINDQNDHGPKFTQNFYSINISEYLNIDSLIIQLNATSKDPILNGQFIYSFKNSSEYFSIESTTGIIRLKKSLLKQNQSNFSLIIQVYETDINLTDETNLFISIENNYYFTNQNCYLKQNQPIGSHICTIGRRTSNELFYEFQNPQDSFYIFKSNGTIINTKFFNSTTEFNLTILIRTQSTIFSSLNLTIYIYDQQIKFLQENSTNIIYFYYPLINTIIHRIDLYNIQKPTNLTIELLNTKYYTFNLLINNTIEIILIEPIRNNRQDNLIIRLENSIDLYINFIYIQEEIFQPKLLIQTIDGYINNGENFSEINLGELLIEKHFDYKLILFNLNNKYFSIKQISNNQTNLYYHQQKQKYRLLKYQIQLTTIAIKNFNLSTNNSIYYYSSLNQTNTYTININLWLINREMLDRTISLIININPQSTYEQFIIESLPLIRENLAQLIGVNIRYVHIYTFNLINSSQIELLIAIIRYPLRSSSSLPRYIHKKLIYNVLKNSTNLLEKLLHIKSIENIFTSKCSLNTCLNNGRCLSLIKLNSNQYKFFSYNNYQRLIPIYQWNIKCLCLNTYYGEYCQLKQNYTLPCLSNPCLANEKCINENSLLYTCQCIDEPCYDYNYNCININSPTCRNTLNTLTFDGYSFVRMNFLINLFEHFNLTFTFRSQILQGKLIKLFNKLKSYELIIQISNGYINIEFNKKLLLEIDDIKINDNLWHKIFFSIDFNNKQYYYLIRLDNVFSKKILLFEINNYDFNEIIIGNDYHGCLGNLTINNKIINIQKQLNNNNSLIEHIGTNDGCQLLEIETRTLRQYKINDDQNICSLYNPCYHGGICKNLNPRSFTCNCLKSRFIGRQCQYDIEPCQSHPCLYNEQCITLVNHTYECLTSSLIHLPLLSSTKNSLYIGIAVTICTLILFILLILSLIIYCQQKSKDKQIIHDKLLVSAPLLIQKSVPNNNNNNIIESPMQTLLKLNNKQTVETMALMNNFNDKQINKSLQSVDKQQQQQDQSQELLNNHHQNDQKSYSTIGRMNIPPDNFLIHYNSIDYDTTHTSLIDPQSTDLFDFPSSPTKYFNGHKDDNTNNYQICINSLSNLTEQNDVELTHSSNDSSNNEQTLLTSPIINNERKHSLFNSNGSTHSVRASTSSLQKAPVYAKIIKPSSKITNGGGMSTIERLRLSGSPLRLLSSSSSSTHARTTSFFKDNHENDSMQISSISKNNKINPTTWKLNPRKLDSLKARRHSRQTDDDDDDNNNNDTNNETSQLTINRLRHASESDLTKGNINGKKSTKLSSFFQTEV